MGSRFRLPGEATKEVPVHEQSSQHELQRLHQVCRSAVDPGAKVEFDPREKKVRIDSDSGRDIFEAALAATGFKSA